MSDQKPICDMIEDELLKALSDESDGSRSLGQPQGQKNPAVDKPKPQSENPPAKAPEPKINWEERRQHERVTIDRPDFQVSFQNQHQFMKMYVQDLSKGGMFVKSNKQVPVGEQVQIAFEIPSLEDPLRRDLFQVKGVVVRSLENGMGISFIEIDEEIRRKIETFIIEEKNRCGRIIPDKKRIGLGRSKLSDERREGAGNRGKRLLAVCLVGTLVIAGTAVFVGAFKRDGDRASAVPNVQEAQSQDQGASTGKRVSLREAGIRINVGQPLQGPPRQ